MARPSSLFALLFNIGLICGEPSGTDHGFRTLRQSCASADSSSCVKPIDLSDKYILNDRLEDVTSAYGHFFGFNAMLALMGCTPLVIPERSMNARVVFVGSNHACLERRGVQKPEIASD